MQRVMLLLLLISGCTLGTRPLTTSEQAVVVDMARSAAPEYPVERIEWLQYLKGETSHAPAWKKNRVIFGSQIRFDPADNSTRWVVAHEMEHVRQAHEHGFWWALKYTADSKRYEDEANLAANTYMEKRSGKADN